jgi:hypothetical protein
MTDDIHDDDFVVHRSEVSATGGAKPGGENTGRRFVEGENSVS